MFWMGDSSDSRREEEGGKTKKQRKRYDILKTASCTVCGKSGPLLSLICLLLKLPNLPHDLDFFLFLLQLSTVLHLYIECRVLSVLQLSVHCVVLARHMAALILLAQTESTKKGLPINHS